MKLQRFKEKNKKKQRIIVFTIACVLLITGVFLYKTFASFQVIENEDFINGDINDPGDIYFAFYKDNVIQKDMPKKKDGYVLDESKSYCGVTGGNDSDIKVHVTENDMIFVEGVTTSRTKCNLYFIKGAYILGKGVPLASEGEDGLYEVPHGTEVSGTINDTGFQQIEYRYAGKSPNNYIRFNDEDWRIIGLVNVLTTNGTVEQRVKIVKDDSIGEYSWDSSLPNVDFGYGVNEWTEADLKTELNEYYLNSTSGTCYINNNNTSQPCDFTQTGIKNNYKGFIEEVIWNTGTNGDTNFSYLNSTNQIYELERSSNLSDLCKSEENDYRCNDDVQRKASWQGKIGLMYPSDFGYATIGVANGVSCKTMNFDNWENNSDCFDNDWLFIKNGEQWLLTPNSNPTYGYTVYYQTSTGRLGYHPAYFPKNVKPTFYLKPNVKIISEGDGSEDNPFQLVQILK